VKVVLPWPYNADFDPTYQTWSSQIEYLSFIAAIAVNPHLPEPGKMDFEKLTNKIPKMWRIVFGGTMAKFSKVDELYNIYVNK